MNNVIIESTKSTPRVLLDFEKNNFIIEGQSYPENASEFYSPITKSIDSYIKESNNPFVLNLKIYYLNTSSTMCFMNLFDKLEEAYKRKKSNITINWIYDEKNEVSLECGEEFKEDFTFPFNIIKDENK